MHLLTAQQAQFGVGPVRSSHSQGTESAFPDWRRRQGRNQPPRRYTKGPSWWWWGGWRWM